MSTARQRGIAASLQPYSESSKAWSKAKAEQVRRDCKRMAWTIDSPAGFYVQNNDGTPSRDLRQNCGVVKCERGELCQRLGQSNMASPGLEGIRLMHGFKLDGSNATPHRIPERDSGVTRNVIANTVDGNLKTELESSGSMDRKATSSVWREIFSNGVSKGMRLFDRLNAKARSLNKDASTPEDNAKAMGGTVDAARFNSKVSGMVIGTSPPDVYRDTGEFLGGSSSGAFPVEGRDSIKSQSDMNFGDRFAERRGASRAAMADSSS